MKSYLLLIISFLVIYSCKNEKKDNNTTKAIGGNKQVKIKASEKQIRVFAKPDSITMELSKTVVIVVDMENDFGSKGGMFDRAGIDISMIKKTINPTAKVLQVARNAGIKIIYLKMGYKQDLSDLGSDDSPNRIRHLKILNVGDTITTPTGTKSRFLIRNLWGTEIVPELKPQAEDIVIYKTRFSGFFKTDLDSILTNLGKKYLIITGCTTSICVESTVRDAMYRDYSSIVLEDCTAEPIGYGFARSNHMASILNIQVLLGWVSSSEEFIKSLTPPINKIKK
jgi:ureidoacrylate peracid hydrolase